MKGEGEGEGNTGRQSSVLEQLNRGRAARDGCSMCGKTDGEAYMLKCRWSKQQGISAHINSRAGPPGALLLLP